MVDASAPSAASDSSGSLDSVVFVAASLDGSGAVDVLVEGRSVAVGDDECVSSQSSPHVSDGVLADVESVRVLDDVEADVLVMLLESPAFLASSSLEPPPPHPASARPTAKTPTHVLPTMRSN